MERSAWVLEGWRGHEGSGGGSKEDLQPAALALGLAETEHLLSSSRTCPGVAQGGCGPSCVAVAMWGFSCSPRGFSVCRQQRCAYWVSCWKVGLRGGADWWVLLLLLFIFLDQISPAALGKGRAPGSPSTSLWGVGPFPSPCSDSLELWLLNCAPSPSLNFLCWLWQCSEEPTPLPPAGRRLS